MAVLTLPASAATRASFGRVDDLVAEIEVGDAGRGERFRFATPSARRRRRRRRRVAAGRSPRTCASWHAAAGAGDGRRAKSAMRAMLRASASRSITRAGVSTAATGWPMRQTPAAHAGLLATCAAGPAFAFVGLVERHVLEVPDVAPADQGEALRRVQQPVDAGVAEQPGARSLQLDPRRGAIEAVHHAAVRDDRDGPAADALPRAAAQRRRSARELRAATRRRRARSRARAGASAGSAPASAPRPRRRSGPRRHRSSVRAGRRSATIGRRRAASGRRSRARARRSLE